MQAALFPAIVLAFVATPAAAQYKVLTAAAAGMTGGTTAFIDATSRRVVEIDADGAVVWHVRIFGDLGVRERDGVYKAVRVMK